MTDARKEAREWLKGKDNNLPVALLDAIKQLDHADELIQQLLDELKGDEREALLIAAIKVLTQTVAEVSHAQSSGSGWYTDGDYGLRKQVRLHLDKANKAIKSVEEILYPPSPTEQTNETR